MAGSVAAATIGASRIPEIPGNTRQGRIEKLMAKMAKPDFSKLHLSQVAFSPMLRWVAIVPRSPSSTVAKKVSISCSEHLNKLKISGDKNSFFSPNLTLCVYMFYIYIYQFSCIFPKDISPSEPATFGRAPSISIDKAAYAAATYTCAWLVGAFGTSELIVGFRSSPKNGEILPFFKGHFCWWSCFGVKVWGSFDACLSNSCHMFTLCFNLLTTVRLKSGSAYFQCWKVWKCLKDSALLMQDLQIAALTAHFAPPNNQSDAPNPSKCTCPTCCGSSTTLGEAIGTILKPPISIKTEKGTRGLLSFGLEMMSFFSTEMYLDPTCIQGHLPTAIAPGELLQGHLSSHLLFPYIYINRFQWCHHWYVPHPWHFSTKFPKTKKMASSQKSPFLTNFFQR